MKRLFMLLMVFALVCMQMSFAEEENQSIWHSIGGWASDAASDFADWADDATDDFADWADGASEDVVDWAEGASEDVVDWADGASEDFADWADGASEDFADWAEGATEDVVDWAEGASDAFSDWADDASEDFVGWAGDAATEAWDWTKSAASSVYDWSVNAASGAWDGISDFFDPPDTQGTPTIVEEPELPEGTQKMYLGYQVVRTGLDNGYSGNREIGRGDPHFGLTLGKFYVSGYTAACSDSDKNFIFLKTVGDNVELHFELVQDIDMLGGDTFVTINADDGGYDRYFGVSPTYFGRGTLIVRKIDYQNNPGEAQVYTDYLSAKMTGDADTVISVNEEGDYEVALDYEIKADSYVLGTKAVNTGYTDYRIFFRFSVRNGNCMIFPFDAVTGDELKNTAVTENGFYLGLAYSRYLDINVKRSVLVEQATGYTEDVRFNRAACDKEKYTDEGIYTISVRNRYTGEETVKTIYVGSDAEYANYVSQGLTVEQIIQAMNT